MKGWRAPMLKTFGVTRLTPSKENRVIFYSILVLLIATGIYIISFYIQSGKGPDESNEDKGDRKGYSLRSHTHKKGLTQHSSAAEQVAQMPCYSLLQE